jgi:hypothetical protein
MVFRVRTREREASKGNPAASACFGVGAERGASPRIAVPGLAGGQARQAGHIGQGAGAVTAALPGNLLDFCRGRGRPPKPAFLNPPSKSQTYGARYTDTATPPFHACPNPSGQPFLMST